jgi:hypothetical protein
MIEVSIDIDAAPDRIYQLVSDLPSMGRWSPECYRCDWLEGATAARPGAKFIGHNRIGMRKWDTKGTVEVADGREIAWSVRSVFNLPVSRWSYRVVDRPGGGSTLVESTEDRRGTVIRSLGWLLLAGTGKGTRTMRNQETMHVTLQRLKEAAESPPG